MSWSGFKKAVNRAGAQITLKTTKQSVETIDVRFDQNEKNFKQLDELTNQLDTELNRVISDFGDLINVQMSLVKTIDSFYGDYSFEIGYDKKVETAGAIINGEKGNDAKNAKVGDVRLINNRDGLSLEYLKLLQDLKERVIPEMLKPYEITVLEPIKQLKDYNVEINKLIKKRYRKKLDYDAILTKVNKIKAEYDDLKIQISESVGNAASDSALQVQLEKTNEKLHKLDPNYNEAKEIYDDLNNSLKSEIEKYISFRLSIIDPVFESFVKIQLKLYKDLNENLSTLSDSTTQKPFKIDAKTKEDYLNGTLDKSLDDILHKMKQLDITTM